MNDPRRRRQRILNWVAIGALVFGTLLRQGMLWMERGMFANAFRRPETGILLQWMVDTPLTDAAGNAVFVDYQWNLLVVFQAGGQGDASIARPFSEQGGVSFDFVRGKAASRCFVSETTRDEMIVLRPDGIVEKTPLKPGDARRILGSLTPGMKDVLPVVDRAVPFLAPKAQPFSQPRGLSAWAPRWQASPSRLAPAEPCHHRSSYKGNALGTGCGENGLSAQRFALGERLARWADGRHEASSRLPRALP